MIKSVKDVSFLAIGQIMGLIFGFITTVLLARMLGPQDYGIYNFLMSIVSGTASFLSLGLAFSAFYFAAKKTEIINSILSIGTITSMVGIIFICLISPFLETTYSTPNLAFFLIIFSFEVLFLNIFNIFLNFFKGTGRFKESSIMNILFNLLRLLGPFLVLIGFGLFGAIFGRILDWTVIISLCFVIGKKTYNVFPRKIKNLKKIMGYGFPLYMNQIFAFFTNQYLIIILAIYGMKLVGYYSASLKLATIISMLTLSISDVALQRIIVAKDKKNVDKITKKITKYSSYLGAFFLVNLVIFSKEIMILIFSKEYLSASTSLIILSFAYFLGSSFRAYSTYFLGKSKTKIVMSVGFISSTILILLSFYLIPSFGLDGAGLSFLFATFVSVMSYVIVSEIKGYKIAFGYKYLLISFFAASMSGIIGKILSYIFPTFLSILIVPPLSIIMMVIVIYLLGGWEEEDERILFDLIYKVFRKN